MTAPRRRRLSASSPETAEGNVRRLRVSVLSLTVVSLLVAAGWVAHYRSTYAGILVMRG
jgi:hypothetical protein